MFFKNILKPSRKFKANLNGEIDFDSQSKNKIKYG